ncbi:pilus assembly protein PilO [Thermosediminibacter litoriperuensis]|uniref:Pilus assembly protein PilO n=1 Tax=Thermosediminibacter litoriperuensis TaxID=291989 RepID=A0A5S5APQ4_9FIRM|nr:pilus assembly protein PilO [Thermosediminibacter litoriperuensis]
MIIILLMALTLFFIQRLIFAQRLPYYIQLKARLRDETAKLDSARETAGNLPVLKKDVERAEAELAAVMEKLGLAFDDRDSFFLAAQPKEPAVRVMLFQPLQEEKRGIFSVQPFQVTVSGDYPRIVSYLLYLETLPALTEIRELKISAGGEKPGEVEAGFVIDLYEIGLEGESIPFSNDYNDKKTSFSQNRKNIFEPVAINRPGKAQEQLPQLSPSSPEAPGGSEKKTGPLAIPSTASYAFPSLDGKSNQVPLPWLEGAKVLRNVGPFYSVGSRKIAIAAREFNRGVVVEVDEGRPVAEAVMDLQARYRVLRGFAGVEDETQNSSGSFILTFLGDERELLKTPVLKPGGYPHYVELNVTGVKRLTVRVEWQESGPGDYDRIAAALANMIFQAEDQPAQK